MTDRLLQTIVADVLGFDPLQKNTTEISFVQAGGDSLQAMNITARALRECNLHISVGELLSNQPLQHVLGMAQPIQPFNLEEERETVHEEAAPSETLTSVQRGMWLVQELVGGTAYNLLFVAHMDGLLHEDMLVDAIKQTVACHEGLRTYFRVSDEDYQRVVVPNYEPELKRVYVSVEANFQALLEVQMKERGQQMFDLVKEPPLMFTLISDGVGKHALLLAVHHILLDGWSVGILFRDLFRFYSALIAGEKVTRSRAPQLDTLLRHQQKLRQSGEIDRQLQFWSAHLADVPFVLELPSDLVRPARQQPVGKRIPFQVSKVATTRMRMVSQQLGITAFTGLLAGYALLLSRYTGQKRFLLGIPSPNRSTPELQELIAPCVNCIPVLINIDEDVSVQQYLIALQHSIGESLSHAEVSLDELIHTLDCEREQDRNTIIQFVMGMHDQLIERNLNLEQLNVIIKDGHGGGSPFDMSLFVQYADSLPGGELEYATTVITDAEAATFLQNFLFTVEELLSHLDSKLEDVRGIAPSQMQRLQQINATEQIYRERSLDHLLEEQAQATPDTLALESPAERITLNFSELNHAAIIQATKLLRAGVVAGDMVIVAIERSIAEIVAVTGILRAGAVYVTVDPQWPEARLQQLLHIASPTAIITSEKDRARLSALSEKDIATVACWQSSWQEELATALPPPRDDMDKLAYVSFTSGSTGTPKGVCITHRNVVRLVDGSATYTECGPGERWLRFAPLAFDASTLEIFGPLLKGGTIVIFPDRLPSPIELGQFIARHRVTRMFLTSGLFRLIVDFSPESFRAVRQVISGGDIVPADHVKRFLHRNPHLYITNGYGPTESTTFAVCFSVASEKEVQTTLPIGYPIPNTQVYVVDERNRLLPLGARGELVIAGDGLAAGYLHNPGETEHCFGHFSKDVDKRLYKTGDVTRFDVENRLHFLGRRDHQVKVRGFRIELEEIRQVICTHHAVTDAVVIVVNNANGMKSLFAVVATGQQGNEFLQEIKDFASKQLPHYTLPHFWKLVEQLPVTQNGKIDRRMLEKMAKEVKPEKQQQVAIVEDEMYSQARAIWENILQHSSFTNEDDFFNIGGDSLRMVRLMGTVRKQFNVNLSLKDFYAQPTLTYLTEVLRSQAQLQPIEV